MAEQSGGAGERGFTLGASTSRPEQEPDGSPIPKIDFSTFVISLGTSALYHMGVVNDPNLGAPAEKNLALARHTVDTLAMLAEKTRGNLDEQELELIESLLYELRMRFVEAGAQ